jgi:hypothetical protein
MSLRRLLVLALLVAAGAAAFLELRGRRAGDAAPPPEWPPFEPRIVPDQPGASGSVPSAPGLAEGWVVPAADGSIPVGYPVKVKVTSGIFHVPGGRFYERTTADRCYPSAAAAEADGYRPSKS